MPSAVPDLTPGELSSDQSLLRGISSGSESKCARLYSRYAERIRGLVRGRIDHSLAARIDADDVVQSTFRAFIEAARRGLFDLPDNESLWNLLATIAINKLRTMSQYHGAACRDVHKTQSIPEYAALNEMLDTALLALVVEDILEHLPESDRQMIQLRLEGYEVAEIAQRTNRSRRTVERLLQRCRHRLTELLEARE